LTADWITHDPDLMSWTRPWEITRHVATTLVVALVGSALRAKTVTAAARIELLERSQRLEREIIKIRDAEQQRIGQDLHDGLCQYLAALACSATSLSEDLRKRKLKSEAAEATELAGLLENAVIQARDLAHELVPAHLAQVGLVLGLQSLTDSVTRLQRIHCTFETHGVGRKYPDDEAKHFYRITQEAINNAVRHGKAHNILVSLHNDSEVTTLQILDDGVGFFEPEANGSGMGLSLMRYRAHQLESELDISHPPSGGTLVSCRTRTNHGNGYKVANS
jgi:signal transduction histidine kinase